MDLSVSEAICTMYTTPPRVNYVIRIVHATDRSTFTQTITRINVDGYIYSATTVVTFPCGLTPKR